MKKQILYIVLMAVGGAGLFSCSQSNLAQTQEYDDLYYTSADRKAEASAQPIAHRGASSGYSDQSFRNNGELAYQEENFSARKVNPEYISRYNVSQEDTIIEEAGVENEYFVEDYDQQNQNQRSNAQDVRIYNYYGRGYNSFGYSPFYDPFMMGGMGFYDPFMMDPFWGPGYMRSGISINFGMSFGFGNRWGMGMYDPFWGRGFYNPYRMGMMGMYDPYWGGMYSPWGMNAYSMGYNNGFYNGMAFNRYYMEGNSPIRNTRTVVSGPRMSRSAGTTASAGRNGRTLARSAENNTTATRANARQADLQSNYYSRSRRDVTEQAVSRSAAASTRRSIDGTAYSRTNAPSQRTYESSRRTAAPAGTEYNRSATPARTQYRTSSPSSGSEYRTGTPSRSSSPQYRSSPSSPSRSSSPQYRSAPSSQPQYRSTPSSPSRGSYSSPSSSPSRSSGYSSPSSSPSRSSAPSGGGGRRGN